MIIFVLALSKGQSEISIIENRVNELTKYILHTVTVTVEIFVSLSE